jgi:hypothetical protein
MCCNKKTGTIGAKPNQFNKWVLNLLGYNPEEDTLDDLFAGSNSMKKHINHYKLFI